MAKIKVTTKFKILELIDRFVDDTTANAIGNTVVTEAKKLISEGQSPVRGIGRFKRYSESYKTAIKGKSKALAGKKVTPVNLNVTGKMLALFGYRIKNDVIEVGYTEAGEHDDLPKYHQAGSGNMPSRPTVPQSGEEWTITIMRAIRDAYGARLEKLIRQANKKG